MDWVNQLGPTTTGRVVLPTVKFVVRPGALLFGDRVQVVRHAGREHRMYMSSAAGEFWVTYVLSKVQDPPSL